MAGLALEHPEGVGVHVTQYGQMIFDGCGILADGEHVDVVLAHVARITAEDFFVGLPRPTIRPALGGDVRNLRLEIAQTAKAVA